MVNSRDGPLVLKLSNYVGSSPLTEVSHGGTQLGTWPEEDVHGRGERVQGARPGKRGVGGGHQESLQVCVLRTWKG